MLMVALKGQSRIDPILLPFGVVSHIGVSQRRQFTGGVLRSVSSRTGAINDDFCILIRQDLRRERRYTFRWQVYCSR
jgi:hypothetical protein